LKLKCDEPLSNVAFNFDLYHYTKGEAGQLRAGEAGAAGAQAALRAALEEAEAAAAEANMRTAAAESRAAEAVEAAEAQSRVGTTELTATAAAATTTTEAAGAMVSQSYLWEAYDKITRADNTWHTTEDSCAVSLHELRDEAGSAVGEPALHALETALAEAEARAVAAESRAGAAEMLAAVASATAVVAVSPAFRRTMPGSGGVTESVGSVAAAAEDEEAVDAEATPTRAARKPRSPLARRASHRSRLASSPSSPASLRASLHNTRNGGGGELASPSVEEYHYNDADSSPSSPSSTIHLSSSTTQLSLRRRCLAPARSSRRSLTALRSKSDALEAKLGAERTVRRDREAARAVTLNTKAADHAALLEGRVGAAEAALSAAAERWSGAGAGFAARMDALRAEAAASVAAFAARVEQAEAVGPVKRRLPRHPPHHRPYSNSPNLSHINLPHHVY